MSLSGGSAFGLASIGALSVLEREGFRPDCVGGNSMGAIIGGVYALGHPLEEIIEMARYIRLRKMVRVTGGMLTQGLHGGWLRPDLAKILRPIVGDARIGDCTIPFVCTAGRVKKPVPWHRIVRPGFTTMFLDCIEPHVFPPETKLLDAMLASSAIPTMFEPVRIGTDSFIDLCNFGAIPAPVLREFQKPDVVISTDTTSDMYAWMWPVLPKSWREFIAAGQDQVRDDLKSADVVITPHLTGNQFRFDKSTDFIAAGKAAAEKKLPEIKALLS
ncbi:MAG TPA: patatin-like phospholipase family protein [Candidatus Peribacteria bacterium]|nr:patatin-like phospholipase family protein [Candidatus Peribacteria bacterium]